MSYRYRNLLYKFVFLFGCTLLATACMKPQKIDKPNVLLIIVDDLNDWTGKLRGHPQSLTPHMDAFAARSMSFDRAYTAAPACNPSRVSLLTGIRPSTSGIYYNEQPLRFINPSALTLPQYFKQHGYYSLGSGKVFHRLYTDPDSWDEFAPSPYQQRFTFPETPPNKSGLDMSHFDWGPVEVADTAMPDYKTVDWVVKQLQQRRFDQPFFMACGIYRPHLPWYVPPAYFNTYPLDSILLPEFSFGDLDDLPEAAKQMIRFQDHNKVTEASRWKAAVQGYLASIHFADAMFGKLMEGLQQSPYWANTIVVLCSDHGWNLGEKQHWRKFALWERTTRIPLMVHVPPSISSALPEGTSPGRVCLNPVDLIHIFPTLTELAGLPKLKENEGSSLVPLVSDPNYPWPHAAISTYGQENHAVRSERFRYIRYADGSEELYNMSSDPREYQNLASDPRFQVVIDKHKAWLPQVNAPVAYMDTAFTNLKKHGLRFNSP